MDEKQPGKQSKRFFGVASHFQNLHHVEWLTWVECKSTTACRSMLGIARLLSCYARTCPLWLRCCSFLLLPPLDWKCRTLSLIIDLLQYGCILMFIGSVEKSISSQCDLNFGQFAYTYETDIMQL